jgi:non-heme chloroperoxidase
LQTKLTRLFSQPFDPALVKELLETGLPAFERDLREAQKRLADAPAGGGGPPVTGAAEQINAGLQNYTKIPVPILAIFAVPHDPGPAAGGDPAVRAKLEASDEAFSGAWVRAFEKGLPSAHVVRIAHTNHYVFQSNEADVLREMNAFLASLPPKPK